MTQHATITGHVSYTPGDGAPLTIPKGPLDLDSSADSVTRSWTAYNGEAGSAALPRDAFERFAREEKIDHTQASTDSAPGPADHA